MNGHGRDIDNIRYSSLPAEPQAETETASTQPYAEDEAWAWQSRRIHEDSTPYAASLDAMEVQTGLSSPSGSAQRRPLPRYLSCKTLSNIFPVYTESTAAQNVFHKPKCIPQRRLVCKAKVQTQVETASIQAQSKSLIKAHSS